jgi:hypothetical protein
MARPTDATLAVLARAGLPLRLEAVAAAARLSPRQASDGVAALVRRGLAERVDGAGRPVSAGFRPLYYRATDAGRSAAAEGARVTSGPMGSHTGRRAAVQGTFRARLWRALRVLRKATVPDLVRLAGTGEEADAEGNAHKYLAALTRSGHVVVLSGRAKGRAQGSNGFKQFVLAKDTGPLAPSVHPARSEVFDPNTEESLRV